MAEENREGLREVALEGLRALINWKQSFASLFSKDMNVKRIFGLLPEHIPEHPIPKQTEQVLKFSGDAALHLGSYFSATLRRMFEYLFDPIEKEQKNLNTVCYYLLEVIEINFEISYAVPVSRYAETVERLLYLEQYCTSDEQLVLIYKILMAIGITPHEHHPDRHLHLRKRILDGALNLLDKQIDGPDIGCMILCCFTNSLIKNESDGGGELMEKVLKHEKLMRCTSGYLNQEYTTAEQEPQIGDIAFPLMDFCEQMPAQGVDTFLKHDLMQPMLFVLTCLHPKDPYCVSPKLLTVIEVLLREAERLVDGSEYLYNPLALRIAEHQGLPILAAFVGDKALIVNRIKEKYFGEAWEIYLARRRGLKTKKAQ